MHIHKYLAFIALFPDAPADAAVQIPGTDGILGAVVEGIVLSGIDGASNQPLRGGNPADFRQSGAEHQGFPAGWVKAGKGTGVHVQPFRCQTEGQGIGSEHLQTVPIHKNQLSGVRAGQQKQLFPQGKHRLNIPVQGINLQSLRGGLRQGMTGHILRCRKDGGLGGFGRGDRLDRIALAAPEHQAAQQQGEKSLHIYCLLARV